MKPLIRKNKSTIQQQGYLQSESWKKSLRIPNIYFIKTQHFKKLNVPGKNATSYMFRPNVLPKKVWVPTKRKSHFSGPNIAPKKVRVQKTYISSKKKELIFFRAKNCAKKKYGCQKKSAKKSMSYKKMDAQTHNFSGPTQCQKKYGFQKSMSSKKKELILF